MASPHLAPSALRWAAALLLCLGAFPARADASLRCGGRLVSVRDRKLDLLGRCGEPAYQESHEEERVVTLRGPGSAVQRRRVRLVVERWTYDRGPREFLTFVTMETGRITAIAQGSYGTAGASPPREAPPPPRATCAPEAPRPGDSAYEVLQKCGEPALRDGRALSRSVAVRVAPGVVEEEVREGSLEVWSYDFGPRSFVRFLVLLDGTLLRVETGGYGYPQ